MKIFLSYRRSHQEYAHSISRALKNAYPSAEVYLDTDVGAPGEDFPIRIRREIYLADLFVVVVTPDFFGSLQNKDSVDYVTDEIKTALQLSVPILPVLEKSEDFPTINSLPLQIRAFARFNAAVIRRMDDGNIDSFQIETRIASVLSRKQRLSLKTRENALVNALVPVLDTLVSPSRFASARSTTRTQALLSGGGLLLLGSLLSWLASQLFAKDAVWVVLRPAMEIAGVLVVASLTLTVVCSIAWLLIRRPPQVSLIFVSSSTSIFAVWVAFSVQTLLAFIALNISGMASETISEVLRLTEMSYTDFVRNLYDALTPTGVGILLFSQMLFFGLSIFYLYDFQRFQCVIHLADTRNAVKWRFMMLFAISLFSLLFFALPAQANEMTFSCTPNYKVNERTNLCLSLTHRSTDSKHPGNIDLRVYGELSHTLKALVFKIKGVQILSSHKSAGGLIRVNKIDIAFAPFLEQSGIGKVVDVKYKWKNSGVGTGTVPIDVRIDGSADQRVAVNQTLELPLPINYADGGKRALFTVWIDFHHPKGGLSAAGWPLYCVYESGSCLSN